MATSTTETRTTTRDVRQIARCKKCKTVRSRLVQVVTTSRYYWNAIGPKCDRTQRTFFDGSDISGWSDRAAGECACERRKKLYFEDVHGTTNPSVPCDERCVFAVGRKCECSCGGKNHGANH